MADLPSDLVVAGVAPAADEAAVARAGGWWRGRLGVAVPAAMVLFILGLCFIWPIIGPVPPPTGGNILMLPPEEIIELEMSVGEGMKMIISGGAVVPPWPRPPVLDPGL